MLVYVVFEEGFTTIALPVIAPGFHVYVSALPLAVSVTEIPAHIVELDALADTDGKAIGPTPTVFVPTQPMESVICTPYVIEEDGFIVTTEPVVGATLTDGVHEYVNAPTPPVAITVIVVEPPLQKVWLPAKELLIEGGVLNANV